MTHGDVKREATEKRHNARVVAFAFAQQLDHDRPLLLFGRLFWLVCDLFEQLIWTHKLDELEGQPITPRIRDWVHNSVHSSVEQLCHRMGLEHVSHELFYWLCGHMHVNGEPLPPPALPDKTMDAKKEKP